MDENRDPIPSPLVLHVPQRMHLVSLQHLRNGWWAMLRLDYSWRNSRGESQYGMGASGSEGVSPQDAIDTARDKMYKLRQEIEDDMPARMLREQSKPRPSVSAEANDLLALLGDVSL